MWRGTAINRDRFENFISRVGKKLHLPGNTSCSRSAPVALGFAFKDNSEGKFPVLFLKLVSNYQGPNGIMLNSEACTSYPSEAEILLKEGV